MKVILSENVPNVGKIGDILDVADGFGRNYLLPRKLAVQANERNVGQFEHNKRVAASRMAKAKAAAEQPAKGLVGLRLTTTKHAGEDGRLFGSVTVREVADLLAEKGFVLDRRDIVVPEGIKTVGEYTVTVQLHAEVAAKVTLEVKAADAE